MLTLPNGNRATRSRINLQGPACGGSERSKLDQGSLGSREVSVASVEAEAEPADREIVNPADFSIPNHVSLPLLCVPHRLKTLKGRARLSVGIYLTLASKANPTMTKR